MIAVEEITQTGRYRRIDESRAGGAVYEAYDSVLETNVMLREIPVRLSKVTSVGQQDALRDAFAKEAKVFTAIKHESIQRVLDFFSEVDRHCLVMEFIPGSDLGDLLDKKRGAFPLHDIMNWADQLLEALHYLHTYNPPIFHRNVGPQNLKLTPGGKIKLLACSFTGDTDAPTGSELNYLPLEQIWSGLDPASQKVITNSYDERSERLLRQPADARSDIYSVGATLYHLITGSVPVDPLERSIDTLEGKNDPLLSPSVLDPCVPGEISEVLMRAMEVKRENRYDSAVIMRQVLRTALVRVKERETVDSVRQDELTVAWEASLAEEQKIEEQQRLEQQRQQAPDAERTRAEEQERLETDRQQALEEERAKAEEEHRRAEQLRIEAEAEKQRLEEERRLAEQTRLELEAEKQRQAELLRRQLREAEEQRLIAEQRAAEAEKKLFDKELENLVDRDAVVAYFDPHTPAVEPGLVAAGPDGSNAKFTESEADIIELELPVDDFEPRLAADEIRQTPRVEAKPESTNAETAELGGIFAEQPAAGSKWKVPVGIVSFLVAGVIGYFGVTSYMEPKAETKQPAAPVIETAKPEPAVQNAALPADSAPTQNTAVTEPAAESTTAATTSAAQPGFRNRPVVQAPAAVKKPEAAPARTPATKKPVTVDDLIKDN